MYSLLKLFSCFLCLGPTLEIREYLQIEHLTVSTSLILYVTLGFEISDSFSLSLKHFFSFALKTISARNTKLKHLNLRWNKICGKGAVAIFRSLMVKQIYVFSW